MIKNSEHMDVNSEDFLNQETVLKIVPSVKIIRNIHLLSILSLSDSQTQGKFKQKMQPNSR